MIWRVSAPNVYIQMIHIDYTMRINQFYVI